MAADKVSHDKMGAMQEEHRREVQARREADVRRRAKIELNHHRAKRNRTGRLSVERTVNSSVIESSAEDVPNRNIVV
jgi:hypothetical protein